MPTASRCVCFRSLLKQTMTFSHFPLYKMKLSGIFLCDTLLWYIFHLQLKCSSLFVKGVLFFLTHKRVQQSPCFHSGDLTIQPITNHIKSLFQEFRSLVSARTVNESDHEKTCLMPYAYNKDADQPAHPRSLIRAFVVRCLNSIISKRSTPKILIP